MATDRKGTEARCEVVEPEIGEHKGRLAKTTGEGFIAAASGIFRPMSKSIVRSRATK